MFMLFFYLHHHVSPVFKKYIVHRKRCLKCTDAMAFTWFRIPLHLEGLQRFTNKQTIDYLLNLIPVGGGVSTPETPLFLSTFCTE